VQLAQTVGSYVWIGASDLETLGSYAWLDGTVFFVRGVPVPGVYQSFGPDQPVAGAGQECVQLHDEPAGPWLSAPCNDLRPYVANASQLISRQKRGASRCYTGCIRCNLPHSPEAN
jgi:hypothetical protein